MNKIKLFCLPYAGGSSVIYNKWKKHTDASIEIVPVELAGRGKRLNEQLYEKIEDAVDDVYETVKNNIEGSYGLFGHSMGAIIAYELAQRINSSSLTKPEYLFVSGRKPPHLKSREKILHILPDGEFKNEIIDMGGTTKEVFENKELLELFLPILRKDFKIVENYKYIKRTPLDIETIAFYGDKEEIEDSEAMKWNKHTNKGCRIFKIEGNHFFINDRTAEVVNIINNIVINEHRRTFSVG